MAAGEVADGSEPVAVPDGEPVLDSVVLGVALGVVLVDVTLGFGVWLLGWLGRGVLACVGVATGVGETVAGGGRTSR